MFYGGIPMAHIVVSLNARLIVEMIMQVKFKALSFKQPWAWLMCKGFKDIENRDWRTKFRGRIYVHASKSQSDMDKETLAFILKRLSNRQASELMLVYSRLTFGAIIGEINITGCLDLHHSPWFFGKYGFTVSEPILYDEPIPCRGKLNFFTPELTQVSVFKLGQ